MLLYTEADIVSDGFIQQVNVLRDIPDVMLPFPNIIENVNPIYTNFPPLWFKQPQDYIGQRGLSCTRSSHKGNGMIFRNSDINIFDSVVTISRIFERHVLQFKVIPDLQPFGISLFSGRGQGGAFLVSQFMQIRQNRIDGVRIVVERVHAFYRLKIEGFNLITAAPKRAMTGTMASALRPCRIMVTAIKSTPLRARSSMMWTGRALKIVFQRSYFRIFLILVSKSFRKYHSRLSTFTSLKPPSPCIRAFILRWR